MNIKHILFNIEFNLRHTFPVQSLTLIIPSADLVWPNHKFLFFFFHLTIFIETVQDTKNKLVEVRQYIKKLN